MRTNDVLFYWSFILLGALLIIYGALGAAYSAKGVLIMFAFTVLHVVLLTIAMLGYIVANRRPTVPERILQVTSFAILYISSIVYMLVAFDSSLLRKKDDELNEAELKEKNLCINYVAYEMILTPLCTSFIALVARMWRDSQNSRPMSIGQRILLVLNLIHLVCLVVFIFIFMEKGLAYVLIFSLSFCIYSLVQYVTRFKYRERAMKISETVKFPPHKINLCWNISNIVLGALVFVGAALWTRYADNNFSDFASYSIIIWIMVALLFFASFGRFIGDRTRMSDMPIYHSPWVFPIYKYYPKVNDIEPYSSGVVFFYLLSAIVFLWSVWVTVEISPSWVGVSITCAVEVTLIFFTLYVVNTNNQQYKSIQEYVDPLVIKTAWCDAKENLVRMCQIDTRLEY